MDFRLHTPVIIYINSIISEHMTALRSYLFRLFGTSGIPDPLRLFVSVIYQQMSGIRYQSHYSEIYPETKAWYSGIIPLHGADKIREHVGMITDGMPAWKLILFQSYVLRNRCPGLLCSRNEKSGDIGNRTADIDVTVSYSFIHFI